MKDESKTKRQLIGELAELRQRLSQLTGELAEARDRVDQLEVRDRDSAARQQMEEALRASVEQWYTAFDVMSDAICMMDSEGKIQRCNRAMVSLLDKPLSEILGHDCWEVVHGTSEPVEGCPAMRMWESLSREGMTIPLGDRWFDVSVDPVLVDDEQSLGAVHVMRDITERVRSEEERVRAQAAVRESEELLRITLENVLDPIFITDDMGEFAYICSNVSNALGYSVEEVRAMGNISLLFRGDLPLYEELHASGEIRNIEGIIETKSGNSRDFLVSAKPVSIGDGTILYTCHDITERKQAEEERSANVRFLECMDRVNRAIQGTNDLEQMMSDVLDEVLSIFDCDRTWFVYPCDPEATTWRAPMERTRPEYPGALTLKLEMPVDSQVVQVYEAVLASDDPVGFGAGNEQPLPADVAKKFNEQSQLAMAVYPKVDKPYMFGIHQCSRPRAWTLEERRLLKEIGTRLADSLTSLLVYRNLRGSESKYRELANSITDVFFAMDADLRYTYWNRASENLTGIKAEDAIGKTIFEVFPDTEETRKAAAVYQDVVKKKQAKSLEIQYQLEDRCRFFEINAYHTEDGIAVFAKDITERRRSEEALREKHANLLAILESTEDLIAVRDRAGRLVFWNSAFARIVRKLSGVEARNGLNITDYLPPGQRAHWERILERVLTGKGYHGDFEWDFGGQEVCSYEIALKPIMKGDDIIGTVEFNRDVTGRKQAEGRIERQRNDLERLSARLIHAQEEERKRISHELHDEIGQALTGISINLAEIEKGLSSTLAQSAGERLAETRSLADRLLEQVRELSLDLRPAMLDDLGLVPTLRWYVKGFAKRASIDVALEATAFDERPAAEVETALYRVVQEALTNIARHANASRVSIRLEREEEKLSAAIEDDGVGFDLQDVPRPGALEAGVGLTGIHERITSLGGKVNIASRPGQGTRVEVEIPLRRQGGSRDQD